MKVMTDDVNGREQWHLRENPRRITEIFLLFLSATSDYLDGIGPFVCPNYGPSGSKSKPLD